MYVLFARCDVVYKLWVLCTSCGHCVQAVGVVYKLWVLCTSCGCCVQAECCELFVGVLTCVAVTGVYR